MPADGINSFSRQTVEKAQLSLDFFDSLKRRRAYFLRFFTLQITNIYVIMPSYTFEGVFMRKIGIRYYDSHLTEENFRKMHDGGMTAVELCLVKEPDSLDFKKVRTLADTYEIDIWTTHLPFQRQWSVIQPTKEERDWAFDFQLKLIERATDIGCTRFVSHPSFIIKEEWNRELTVRDFYNNAMEIFSGKQPSRV